jgi:hypothetical protein
LMRHDHTLLRRAHETGLSAALLATVDPVFGRRGCAAPAPWSTIDLLAASKHLGWIVQGPEGAARATYRNDALLRPEWGADALAWGVEPAAAVVTQRRRGRTKTAIYLTLRPLTGLDRRIVGPSACPAIHLAAGQPLRPQLHAAFAILETAWRRLHPALPVWQQESVPLHECVGTAAQLDARRPLPAARPARLSPWHPLQRRFASGATRFIDRPSPYATPETTPPASLGLPGDWDPPGSRWDQYLRWTHEYALGGQDPTTGRKRPQLRDGPAPCCRRFGSLRWAIPPSPALPRRPGRPAPLQYI